LTEIRSDLDSDQSQLLEDHPLFEDNLPNRITIFRVFLIPVIFVCLWLIILDIESLRSHFDLMGWIAGWTFTLASITDFFDGYIARKRGIETVFGSFLDPIADKFLVVSSLVLLHGLGRIPTIVVVILVLRELYMTSLRLLANTEGVTVPVSSLGKWKTGAQMVGIPMLMANQPLWGIPLTIIGPISIYAASFLSVYSAVIYSMNLVQKLKAARLEKKRSRKSE
jgi:CDP-diacylglycerol--glycerol-3-phosphate 3-phosphatidyltransferase